MFRPKRYVILGHSKISVQNKDEIVPKGVRLVLLGQCGHVYSKNWEHAPILRSTNRTNNFLNSNKVQFYNAGNTYRNQVVNMPLKNEHSLLHGVYHLPVNMLQPRKCIKYNRNKCVEHSTRPLPGSKTRNLSRGSESARVSQILKAMSNKGGGTIIGIFCRGFENVAKSNTTNRGTRKAANKRNRATQVNSNYGTKYLGAKGGIEKYKTLRRIQHRKGYLNAIAKAESIRPIKPPTGVRRKPSFWNFLKKRQL